MIANKLIARALDLCARTGRPLPTELKAYASDWQRQRYDLAWCWGTVKNALREGRAIWLVDVEVRRHYARLQASKDARDLKAGEPLGTAPAPDPEGWWDTHSPERALPRSAMAGGSPDDPHALR